LSAENLAAAMSAFEAAIERDPTSELTRIGYAEGLFARGEQRNRMGAARQAVQDFAAAARQLSTVKNEDLAGRSAAGAYRAGLRLESQRIAAGGEIGDEVLAFQAAYDLDPENAGYKSKLAQTRNALGAQNKYKDAAYAYKRAHDLYKTNMDYRDSTVAAFRQWGQESLTYRRFDDAIEAFRTAYRVQPSNTDARLELASAFNERGLEHLEAGRIAAALADFREAVHYDPDNDDYQQNLSQAD
jgi:tetratricopeptide (TPR) repeat protein